MKFYMHKSMNIMFAFLLVLFTLIFLIELFNDVSYKSFTIANNPFWSLIGIAYSILMLYCYGRKIKISDKGVISYFLFSKRQLLWDQIIEVGIGNVLMACGLYNVEYIFFSTYNLRKQDKENLVDLMLKRKYTVIGLKKSNDVLNSIIKNSPEHKIKINY